MPGRGGLMAISVRHRNRGGRRRGDIAQAILEHLRTEPATIRTVAERHQIGLRVAKWTASRLATSGLIRAVGLEATGRRPAAIYRCVVCEMGSPQYPLAGLFPRK